jgi:predicted unusual protein kinase regulating ubiquinone biosynthesis (AarF/ABC1/UbiB family)
MLAYNKMFKKSLKNILFLLNVGFIFGIEYLLYYVFNDYYLFIDRLTTKLASVNILYVKIFQAFALNNSLIDNTINNKLLKFTDNAPWNYSDINFKELSDVAEKYDLHLGHGYEVPINSGMISLVFKVSKKSNLNEKVIIKMKRKNIQEKLNDAIDNLLFLIYILSFIPIVNKYQLAEVVSKNVEIIRHQTNFLEEIDNMHLVRENCKNLKYVKIPTAVRKVTEEYSDIILMEYIQGIKINQIIEEDYEGFAKSVVKFGLVTTIVHGVAHGDLHSGNIMFIKDNKDIKYPYKIGVIDFGIIYHVNSQYKESMFDIFSNLFDRPSRESAIKLLNSGIIEPLDIMKQIPKSDYNNILDFTEEILNETIHSSKMANQIQIYKFLSKLKAYLSKRELMNLGIRPSDNFVKSQLVLAMAHGVTLTLCKGDFMTLMDNCLNELFHTKMIL